MLAGVLLVDKPVGPTSHDIVKSLRKHPALSGLKVGHTGTLDPFASGVLLVTAGHATRYQDQLMALDKSYLAEARFGATSDTGDSDGNIVGTGMTTDEGRIVKALSAFEGTIKQRVPARSAIKVDGQPLYKKAHRGEPVETPTRRVTVKRLKLKGFNRDSQTAQIEVVCSKGTYIRQLVADLGQRLGCGAYCHALRRLAIGSVSVDRAATPKRILADEGLQGQSYWLPLKVEIGELSVF